MDCDLNMEQNDVFFFKFDKECQFDPSISSITFTVTGGRHELVPNNVFTEAEKFAKVC